MIKKLLSRIKWVDPRPLSNSALSTKLFEDKTIGTLINIIEENFPDHVYDSQSKMWSFDYNGYLIKIAYIGDYQYKEINTNGIWLKGKVPRIHNK